MLPSLSLSPLETMAEILTSGRAKIVAVYAERGFGENDIIGIAGSLDQASNRAV